MNDQCTEDRFLGDVKDHSMTIIRDDGIDRHIRFKKPGTSCYYFELITWPGYLCVTGDCGTYVFQRTTDMFEFFRVHPSDFNRRPENKLHINKGYWAEKCQSISCNGGMEEFSEELFKAAIKQHFDDHFQEEIEEEAGRRAECTEEYPLFPYEVEKFKLAAERRAEIWEAIEQEVLHNSDDEHEAQQSAHDFEHDGFVFQDFHEHRLTDYTYHFVWNLYAIAWGIQQYDLAKEKEEVPA